MKKTALVSVILLLLLPILAGCSSGKKVIPVTTDFGRMLGSVPASVLGGHRVWYQDPGLALEQAGFGQVNSFAAYQSLSDEQKQAFGSALSGVTVYGLTSRLSDADTFGWDFLMMKRTMFAETPPPYGFGISEGTFDVPLIEDKFTAQGYTEASYDGVSYLTRGGDYQIDMTSAFTQKVLAAFNRLMVTDDTLITAPTTGIMDGILDARTGKTNLTDMPAGRALAAAMGEVYAAVIVSPEVVPYEPSSGQPPPAFDLPAARDWGRLHTYEMAGIDYRRDGSDSYLDICVTYFSAADAKADAPELAKRLNGYVLNTNGMFQQVAFTDAYETGEPTITTYGNSTVVKISCRRIASPDVGRAVSLMIMGQTGDLLFLAPDPSSWLAP